MGCRMTLEGWSACFACRSPGFNLQYCTASPQNGPSHLKPSLSPTPTPQNNKTNEQKTVRGKREDKCLLGLKRPQTLSLTPDGLLRTAGCGPSGHLHRETQAAPLSRTQALNQPACIVRPRNTLRNNPGPPKTE